MKRKSQKTTATFIIIFVLAFALALFITQALPIPAKAEKLAFFLLIPIFSGIGVFIVSKLTKRR